MMLRALVHLQATALQAVEYLVALFLVLFALRQTDVASTVAMLSLAVAIAVVAALSSGPLAWRRVLSPRLHRIAEVALVVACVAAIAAITRGDLRATLPIGAAAAVLVRLALVPTLVPPTSDLDGDGTRVGALDRLQPRIDRTARAAGIFVRNRRANRRN